MAKILIYAAGNPDAYPIEYYDPETGTYQGMIPELLHRFSEESDYDIRYYAAGERDQRERLAENLQVDLISGCGGSEELSGLAGEAIEILAAEQNGEETEYRLYVTAAAPEAFAAELGGFLEGIGQEARTGLLLDISRRESGTVQPRVRMAFGGLLLAAAAATAALAFLLRKYRKRLKLLTEERETDTATGIGNKEHLERYCRTMLHDKNRVLYWMFYFYFDIEKMERSGSHTDVREFVRNMAVVLQNYTRDTDILARIADNGFAILRLSDNEKEAKEWFFPALERIRGFSESHGRSLSCDAAVGIYPLRADDRDLDVILFNAAQSALEACRRGEDFEVCTDELIRKLHEEQQLQGDIGWGFQNEEFQLYIQFYVDAKEARIVGGEALSRWLHPEKGLLLPGRYVPLMEKAGTISRLDYYSLEKSCAFLESLERNGCRDFFLSCNVSRETFSEQDFLERCREILGAYRFSRELLILEITESAMNHDFGVIKKNLLGIREMGLRVSLDDFGEGFTSFFDIQEYPLDVLKLDKSLTDYLGTTAGNAILRSMIQVGHELELTVMAEGVEREEQVRLLREMDCDVIQGFRFYQPLPVWEAMRLIRERAGEQRLTG